jgi:O-antigen/teichoic acid export membrane protein
MAEPEADAPAVDGEIKDLRKRAVRGSIVELLGHAGSQSIRFVNSIILSRLLFPEAYGMVAIVSVLLTAVVMLSDLGIRTAVTRSPRGDEPDFLNTAWTLNLIRNVVLYGVVLLLAWPLAKLYDKPEIAPLLMVSGLTFVIQGFESTVVLTLSRRVQRDKLVMLDLISQVMSSIVMITWALHWPSVWALAAGGLAATSTLVIGSHLVVRRRHRFQLEPTASKELKDFGKWVIGSSAFSLGAQEGDRLLLGYYLDLATMGAYSIAMTLANAIGAMSNRLTGVLLGVFSHTAQKRPEDLPRVFHEARLRLHLTFPALLGGLAVFGPLVVKILYDARYQSAGWMLRILCVRAALACVSAPSTACLIALGEPRQTMISQGARFVATWSAVPIGFHLYGIQGALWGVTIAELAQIVPLWIACAKHGLFKLSRELIPVAGFVAGGLLAYAIEPVVSGVLLDLVASLKQLKEAYF